MRIWVASTADPRLVSDKCDGIGYIPQRRYQRAKRTCRPSARVHIFGPVFSIANRTKKLYHAHRGMYLIMLTCSASRLSASMPASTQTAFSCAPLKSSQDLASSSKFTSPGDFERHSHTTQVKCGPTQTGVKRLRTHGSYVRRRIG